MRVPIFKITNDDEPVSMDYPCAVSLDTLRMNGDDSLGEMGSLAVGSSVTVGGGAAVQFTIERIR